MPQVATTDLVEISTQVLPTYGSYPMYNVWHIRKIGPAAPAAAAAIANLNTFYGAIKQYYRAPTSITSGYRTIDRSVVPWSVVPASSANTVGTASTGLVAPQLAMVVSWRTLTVGKSYRGRTFLGPFDLFASSGATWTGACMGSVSTAATNLIAAGLASGVYIPVVFSSKNNALTQITSLTVSTAMRTLRSRA